MSYTADIKEGLREVHEIQTEWDELLRKLDKRLTLLENMDLEDDGADEIIVRPLFI
ncbi:hypothetical protein ACK8P5_25935 (plasmid) [Paenibacillus sp. EC2-1]|uniref:hypothetical protein n=1 Tax=Paenibacillus sp. EC2-1 TaxID=3388665 RepID=UPI003BEEB336